LTQCQAESATSQLDLTLINVAKIAYYVAIGMHLVIIMLTLNRVVSIKVKKFIDAFQVIALIYYYRYPQQEIASLSLKVMDAFNFNYLSTLICNKQAPPLGCNVF